MDATPFIERAFWEGWKNGLLVGLVGGAWLLYGLLVLARRFLEKRRIWP